MGKPKKKRRLEIRFSIFSLAYLVACWVGIALLAYYLGFYMGRSGQIKSSRQRHRLFEQVNEEKGESLPLTFSKALTATGNESESLLFDGRRDTDASPEKDKTVSDRYGSTKNRGAPVIPSAGHALNQTEHRQKTVVSGNQKTLQVASFNDLEKAKRLIRDLEKKGYSCFFTEMVLPDSQKTHYRVIVGPFTNEKAAVGVKNKLEKDGRLKGILILSGSP